MKKVIYIQKEMEHDEPEPAYFIDWIRNFTRGTLSHERNKELLNKLKSHMDDVDYNGLARVLIHHLDYVPELTHLTLWCFNLGLDHDDFLTLAKGLRHVPNLSHLYLWNDQIGDEGVAALAKGLQHVPKLRYIDLRGNQIGDEGAAALSKRLHHVPKLTYLGLWDNQIGDEGRLYLSYLLPNKIGTNIKLERRIHPIVLSYVLLSLSEYPFYDLLGSWEGTFGYLRQKETIRNLLTL